MCNTSRDCTHLIIDTARWTWPGSHGILPRKVLASATAKSSLTKVVCACIRKISFFRLLIIISTCFDIVTTTSLGHRAHEPIHSLNPEMSDGPAAAGSHRAFVNRLNVFLSESPFDCRFYSSFIAGSCRHTSIAILSVFTFIYCGQVWPQIRAGGGCRQKAIPRIPTHTQSSGLGCTCGRARYPLHLAQPSGCVSISAVAPAHSAASALDA